MLQPLFSQALGAFGRVEALNHFRDVFREMRAVVAWSTHPHSWAKRVCGFRKNLQGFGMELDGAGAAAILLPLSKGFWFPLNYQTEDEWGCAILQLFLKNHLFYTVSDVPVVGNEEEKGEQILLRAWQWSMARACSGSIVATHFSALAIFPSKQKPQKYLILLCWWYEG